MYRQFELCSQNREMVCWLEDDRRLHVGRRISLKGSITAWRITERYSTLLESPPEKKWQVGGLL